MDNPQTPSFEIPKNTETPPPSRVGDEFDPSLDIEGTREILPAPAAQQPSLSTVTNSAPIVPKNATNPSPTVGAKPVQSDDSHLIADDVDVIEKEWVERAKKIISLTSDDPYVETKEISKLKATYMKKRFNKDIQLANDGAS